MQIEALIGQTTDNFHRMAGVVFYDLGDGRNKADTRPNIAAFQGSSSAGKTWGDMQIALLLAASTPGTTITVAGRSIPNLKQGAISDFRSIVSQSVLKGSITENRVEKTFTFANGSIINFDSFDLDKAHGPRRDWLFLNEAYFIPQEVSSALIDRTRIATIAEFNPVSRFWIHDDVDRGTAIPLRLTFDGNEFCPPATVRRLESYRTTNPAKWQVYGEGRIGQVEGLVFNYSVSQKPDGAKLVGYGLDFGYNPDPTACIAVWRAGNGLWLEEIIYQRDLLPSQIAKLIKQKCEPGATIYADSARPDIIRELGSYGLIIRGAAKGAGSILSGITIMQEYDLHIMSNSPYLVDEFSSYFLPQNNLGQVVQGNPVGKADHGIDAARYLISSVLSNKMQQPRGSAIVRPADLLIR